MAYEGKINGQLEAAETITATPYSPGINKILLCDATAANITINLPAVNVAHGWEYIVKKIDASGNTITLDGSGAETIDGAATLVIGTQWNAVHIHCDGVAWYVLNSKN